MPKPVALTEVRMDDLDPSVAEQLLAAMYPGSQAPARQSPIDELRAAQQAALARVRDQQPATSEPRPEPATSEPGVFTSDHPVIGLVLFAQKAAGGQIDMPRDGRITLKLYEGVGVYIRYTDDGATAALYVGKTQVAKWELPALGENELTIIRSVSGKKGSE